MKEKYLKFINKYKPKNFDDFCCCLLSWEKKDEFKREMHRFSLYFITIRNSNVSHNNIVGIWGFERVWVASAVLCIVCVFVFFCESTRVGIGKWIFTFWIFVISFTRQLCLLLPSCPNVHVHEFATNLLLVLNLMAAKF